MNSAYTEQLPVVPRTRYNCRGFKRLTGVASIGMRLKSGNAPVVVAALSEGRR